MPTTTTEGIRWPAEYAPGRAPIHVRNELEMDVPVERVWAWLRCAARWPSWYRNSRAVRFLDGAPPDLALGTRFRWTTFGVRIESRVCELVERERLAWDARGIGVRAYHAWLLLPTARGTYVLTEETQHGFAARLGDLLMPRRMSHHHQLWLEGLAEQARRGLPPAGAPITSS